MAQLVKSLPAMREAWVRSPGWEDTLEKGRLPTVVFWPGNFHGLYSPWGHKESNTTEQLSLLSFNLILSLWLVFVTHVVMGLKTHICPIVISRNTLKSSARAQSCPALCAPVDSSPPGSSVLGVLQARILDGLPFPFPGDLPDLGIEPASSASPVLQADY